MNAFRKPLKSEPMKKRHCCEKAFSLIEVVMAMGVFLITVLALVGLMGPALLSVNKVQTTDEVASVVDSVNAFLNSSPWINPGGSRFEAIYRAIQVDDNSATLLVYDWYENRGNDAEGNPILITRKEIGFEDNQGGNVNGNALVNANRADDGIPTAGYDSAVSRLYRVVLTASSAMLADGYVNEGAEGAYPRYTLNRGIGAYLGNYLALEVRIFAEEMSLAPPTTNMANLADEVPILVYDTAILRD